MFWSAGISTPSTWLFAAWAAVLWLVGPLLFLRGFVPRFHYAFDQYFLAPHWFGLTNMADFP